MLRRGFGHFISFNLLVWCQLWAQTANGVKTFEVASVKRSVPNSGGRPSIRGGPGSSSPGQFAATDVSLKDLVVKAFGLDSYQLSGPAWLASEHYDIVAKIPPSTTKDEFQIMQQLLLVERFDLKFHYERRAAGGYVLSVDKGGPKILPVESAGEQNPINAFFKDGMVHAAPDESRVMRFKGGLGAGILAANAPMGRVASELGHSLKTDVIDETGLTGKFSFRLDFINPDRVVTEQQLAEFSVHLVDVFTAVRQQLGLRLDRRRMPVDTLVVDHLSKVPVEK
jgi:uncharacterized protein (TIGR03435 family)